MREREFSLSKKGKNQKKKERKKGVERKKRKKKRSPVETGKLTRRKMKGSNEGQKAMRKTRKPR